MTSKEKQNEYQRKYYHRVIKKNKLKMMKRSELSKQYRLDNLDYFKKYGVKYRKENAEKIKEYKRKNKEE